MADALSWLLASRHQILDVIELAEKGPENPALSEALPGFVNFFTDLCHVQAARAGGEAGRICADLLFGFHNHSTANSDPTGSSCDCSSETENSLNPEDVESFASLRVKLDTCLAGSRLAKDRAARALSQVMIPEALDYPL